MELIGAISLQFDDRLGFGTLEFLPKRKTALQYLSEIPGSYSKNKNGL